MSVIAPLKSMVVECVGADSFVLIEFAGTNVMAIGIVSMAVWNSTTLAGWLAVAARTGWRRADELGLC